MKYKGKELMEFTSDRPVVFDPPKKMLCWDSEGSSPVQNEMYAYLPKHDFPVKCSESVWQHCAELPEEPKPRRATNMELAKWLAKGNGLCTHCSGVSVWTGVDMDEDSLATECNPDYRIRKWDDKEWHEPTADYMGLEG